MKRPALSCAAVSRPTLLARDHLSDQGNGLSSLVLAVDSVGTTSTSRFGMLLADRDTGHFGIQYAKAMGMRVIAVDGGEEKDKLCKELGAEQYIDFTKTKDIAAEVMKITTYGAHGVIVFAASKEGYAIAPSLLRPGGTVVAVGLPSDPTVLAGAPPIMLALKRLNIVGSVTGTLRVSE